MDHGSFSDAIAASGPLITNVTKAINGLRRLRGKYAAADGTAHAVVDELQLVKASLSNLRRWAQNNKQAAESCDEDFQNQFEIARDNVEEVLRDLQTEVDRLLEVDTDGGEDEGWDEESMKSHKSVLHDSMALLHTLVQASQCSSRIERQSILHQPRNQEIVRSVADDTSTIRGRSTRPARSNTTSSIASRRTSVISSTIFSLDSEMRTSAIYRRSTRPDERAIPKLTTENVAALNEVREHKLNNSLPRNKAVERDRNDSGMGSVRSPTDTESTMGRDLLSPLGSSALRQRPKPRPYQHSMSSEPIHHSRTWNRPIIHVSSASDSAVPRVSQGSPRAVTPDTASKWSSINPFKRSKNKLSESEDLLSPKETSRRGRRRAGSETDLRTSVDFSGPDGLNAPLIVRAAQSGSVREIEELLEHGANIEERHYASGRTALAVAAHCGNDDVVRYLIQARQPARTDIRDVDDMTPLHLASMRGHYRVVELLLMEEVEIDAQGPEKRTSLRLACDYGHLAVIKLLLQHRAGINARDANHMTALHSAAQNGEDEIVRLLLSCGADYEGRDANLMAPIHYACTGTHERHEAVVEALLSKRADSHLESPGHDSMSPLSCACANGSDRIVKLLLRKKASLKHRSHADMTPLHWAAFNGHYEVVRLLLAKKASIDARTSDNRTALHLAVISPSDGKFATVDLLLLNGAGIEAQCSAGLRPLHYACQDPDENVVSRILGAGANVEVETTTKKRPLHIASQNGAINIINLLLQRGADTEVRDGGGDRALGHAAAHGHVDLVRYYLNMGIPMRARFSGRGRSHEDSPLCLASKYGHLEVVQELIVRGASALQRDEQDWQPLRYAAHYGHAEIVQDLLDSGASISGLLPSGGWGFNMTATRIGFAPDIDEEKKGEVLRLLLAAEAKENARSEQSYPTVAPAQLAGVFEKDDDGSTDPAVAASEKDNDRETPPPMSPTRPPPPLPNPIFLRPPVTDPPPVGLSRGMSTLVSRFRFAHNKNKSTSGLNGLAVPTQQNEPAERLGSHVSSLSTVTDMPGPASRNASSVESGRRPISTYIPSPYDQASTDPSPNFQPFPYESARHPPPTGYEPLTSLLPPTTSDPYGDAPYDSPPGSELPVPPAAMPPREETAGQIAALREMDFATGDIVACAECAKKGYTRPDLTCEPCRRVLYEYRYIMGQISGADTRGSQLYEMG